MKVIIKVILAVVVPMLCAIEKAAAESTTVNGVTYTISSTLSDAYVSSIDDSITDLVIESRVIIGGWVHTVAGIKSKACKGNKNLKSVTASRAISVSSYAFQNCTNLQKVTITGTSSATIGEYAFNGCTALSTVELPEGLNRIYAHAFEDCTNLKFLEIPDSVTIIDAYAFKNSGLMGRLYLPSSLTKIFDGAFYGCSGIEAVDLPASLTTVSTDAFFGTNIEYVVNMSSITLGAYTHTAELSSASVITPGYEDSNHYIYTDAARTEVIGNLNKTATSLTIPSQVASVAPYAFYHRDKLTSISMPNSITRIGYRAFYECYGWDINLTLPLALKSIGKQSFYCCTALRSIDFPDGLTSIGGGAFRGCTNISGTFNLPATLTTIGDEAFFACSNLMSTLQLPENIISIGSNAFYGCTGFNKTVLHPSTPTIGDQAFYGCTNLETVVNYSDYELTAGSTDYGYIAYYATDVVTGDSTIDGFVYTDDTYTTLVYYLDQEARRLVIPSGTTTISEGAFYGYTNLQSIVIPASVLTIEKDAFASCPNLKKVVLLGNTVPDGLSNAFDTVEGRHTYVSNSKYASYSALGIISTYSNLSSYFENDGLVYVPVSLAGRTCDLIDCTYDEESTVLNIEPTTTYHNIVMNVQTVKSNVAINNPYVTRATYNISGEMAPFVFYGCNNLQFLTIGENTTSISGTAVTGTKGMTSLTINDCDTPFALGDYTDAFKGSSLAEIYYGRQLTFNKTGAYHTPFNGISTLRSIKIGGTVTAIEPYMFTASAAEGVVISAQELTTIGESAFYNCPQLTTVAFGSPVLKEIQQNAFYGCEKLEHVEIGSEVFRALGEHAFDGCKSLGTVSLTSHVLPTISAYAFSGCSALEVINFPTGIQTIGQYAFHGCASLKTVSFPSTLQSIGAYSFSNCGLTSLRLPSSVQTIGRDAFEGSTSMVTIRIDDSATALEIEASPNFAERSYGLLAKSGAKSAYLGRNLSCNEQPAFRGCSTLEQLELSEYVTALEPYAFYDNTALQIANIPSSLKAIPEYAFYNCSSLVEALFPSSITSIGDFAYYNNGFSSLTLPSTVQTVGESAFRNASKLKYASVGAVSLGAYAFRGCALRTVDVLPTLANMDFYAFAENQYLTTANVEGLMVGPFAFASCDDLQTVTLGSLTTAIRDNAFNSCSSLTNINIPEGVEQIEEKTFYRCSSLKEISLPSTIGAIDIEAFYGTNLSSILVPGNVINIFDYAFSNIPSLTSLTMYDGGKTVNIVNNAFEESPLQTLILNRQLTYDTENGSPFAGKSTITSVSMNDRPTSLLSGLFKGCTGLVSARIGDNVKEIGEYAFQGCSALTTVNVPAGVTEIRKYTFDGCSSLEALDLPSSIAYLREYSLRNTGLRSFVFEPSMVQVAIGSFSGCTSLRDIVAKSGSKTLEISNAASYKGMFSDCPLEKVSIDRPMSYSILPEYGYSPFYRSNTLKTVELGDYPTSVPDNMFYGCSAITDVIIGDGVKSFGEWSFSGCSSIQRFYFGGNVENIGSEAFSDCSAMVELWSKAAVPPVCGEQALADINKWDCELFVPVGTVPSYAAADQWEDFFNMGESTGKTILPTGITLNKLTLNMEVDETSTINAVVLPMSVDGDWVPAWTSTNEDVAVVTNGRVVAMGEGTCQIVASLEANGTILSACDVTVKKHTQELLWVQAFGAVYVGDIINLKGSADSGLPVEFSVTGGDNIAYIYDGQLMITGLGTVEVTAVQPGDSRYYATNEITRSITVIPVNPTAVSLDDYVTVHVGQSMGINASIEPINASDKSITWRSIDESIATVDTNGNVTGVFNGETYVIATLSNGLSATCAVKVNSLGDDYLAVNDIEMGCGETYRIPVVLTNLNDIAGAEFDIELPSCLSFVADEAGAPTVELADRASGFLMGINQLSDNTVHVEIYGASDILFTGESGDDLAYVTVKAGYSSSTQLIRICEIKLYDSTYASILPGDDNATVTINGGLLGDVNENGVVNMGDAIMIVNHSLGISLSGFNADLADVDGNGVINLGDGIQVVNYSLGVINEFTGHAKSMMKSVGNLFAEVKANDLTFTANQWQDLEISLNGFDEFTALQLTLDIPAGYEYDVEAMALSGRVEDHQLMINDRGNGSISLAVISLSLAPISGNDGVVLTLPIRPKADAYDLEMLHISSALAIEPDGTVHVAADSDTPIRYTQGQSGIWSVNPDEVTIYNEGHTIHVVLPQPMTVTVTTVNGQYQTYKFLAGDNQIEVPTCGVYIVSTAVKQAKISIF